MFLLARHPGQCKHPSLWDGLVGLWAAPGGPTGGAARNLSAHGSKYDGSLSYPGAGDATWAVGPWGWAMRCTASKARVSVPDPACISQYRGSLVIGYTRRAAAPTYATLLNVETPAYNSGHQMAWIGRDAAGLKFFPNRDANLNRYWLWNGFPGTDALNNCVLGQRYVFGVSWDTDGATYGILHGYLDGAPCGSESGGPWTTAPWTSGERLSIGGSQTVINSFQSAGDIDCCYAYNRVLAPNEMALLNHDPLAPLRRRRRPPLRGFRRGPHRLDRGQTFATGGAAGEAFAAGAAIGQYFHTGATAGATHG